MKFYIDIAYTHPIFGPYQNHSLFFTLEKENPEEILNLISTNDFQLFATITFSKKNPNNSILNDKIKYQSSEIIKSKWILLGYYSESISQTIKFNSKLTYDIWLLNNDNDEIYNDIANVINSSIKIFHQKVWTLNFNSKEKSDCFIPEFKFFNGNNKLEFVKNKFWMKKQIKILEQINLNKKFFILFAQTGIIFQECQKIIIDYLNRININYHK